MRLSRILPLFLTTLVGLSAAAYAEEHPAASQSPAESKPQSSPQSAERSPEPSSEQPPREQQQEQSQPRPAGPEVEPLDVWEELPPVPGEPAKSSEPKKRITAGLTLGDLEKLTEDSEKGSVNDTEEEEPIHTSPVSSIPKKSRYTPRILKQTLSKQERARMTRAKAKYEKLARKVQRMQREQLRKDYRGEPEVRVCSVDLNNMGTPAIAKRAGQSGPLSERAAGIAEVILKARCNIVAVQGVLGKTHEEAHESFDFFLRKLKRDDKISWNAFAGATLDRNSYNGFLVEHGFEVVNARSHTDILLPKVGRFQQTKFIRTPVEIVVRVRGKGTAENRLLRILNFDLRKALTAERPEPEKVRVQAAEALRQLVNFDEDSFVETQDPIFLMTGEKASPFRSLTTRLLEGRIRLNDFSRTGSCTLADPDKLTCESELRYPKTIFGVLADNLPPRNRVTTEKVKDKVVQKVDKTAEAKFYKRRKKILESTVDIYMRQEDLKYAYTKVNRPNRFNSGMFPVRNGLKKSPLVWVELNW